MELKNDVDWTDMYNLLTSLQDILTQNEYQLLLDHVSNKRKEFWADYAVEDETPYFRIQCILGFIALNSDGKHLPPLSP